MDKYHGEFSELETLVAGLGYRGQWDEDNGKKVFRSEDKAVLNWWPLTGTLQVQGPATPRTRLDEAMTRGPVRRHLRVRRNGANHADHRC